MSYPAVIFYGPIEMEKEQLVEEAKIVYRFHQLVGWRVNGLIPTLTFPC